MEVTFLQHAFGLRDIAYIKTTYPEGLIHIHVRTNRDRLNCSNCGSNDVVKKGIKTRTFRTIPVGLQRVNIVAEVQRLECKACKVTRQEHLSWVDKKNIYSKIS